MNSDPKSPKYGNPYAGVQSLLSFKILILDANRREPGPFSTGFVYFEGPDMEVLNIVI